MTRVAIRLDRWSLSEEITEEEGTKLVLRNGGDRKSKEFRKNNQLRNNTKVKPGTMTTDYIEGSLLRDDSLIFTPCAT